MKLRSLFVLFIIIIFGACKKGKDGPIGPTGPAGPSYKGIIKGYVTIYDPYGGHSRAALQDVQLTLNGGRTVNADSNGSYSFDSVVTGNYTISVSGVSIAPSVIYNVQFIKDTLFQAVNVSQPASFPLTSLVVGRTDTTDSVVVTFDRDISGTRGCAIFLSNTLDVSNMNYRLVYLNTIAPSTFGVRFTVSSADLHSAGFSSGQTVYYAAYPYVNNDYSAYVNFNTGKTVYSAVGSPLTTSTTAP